MDSVDLALSELKEKLVERLPHIADRTLRQILTDYLKLEESKEISSKILGGMSPTAPPHFDVQPSSTPIIQTPSDEIPRGPLTRGDASVEVLRQAGRPMHIKELADAITKYGYDSPPRNLVAILKRDSLNRFINTGGNVYKLNEEALATGAEGYYARDGSLPLRRKRTTKIKEMGGITLKQAILMGIENQPDEFTPPMVYEYLQTRFPRTAVNIHITSVNAILNNLAKGGGIKEIRGGRAGTPKTYRKKLQLVEDDAGDRAMRETFRLSQSK